MTFSDRLIPLRQRIDIACQRAKRDPNSVRLVAVSKLKPASAIVEARAVGQELFGESYVQEFLGKYEEISPSPHWHFIGALQSNKVKYLKGKVDLIHSVDRLSLAQEIARQWRDQATSANILLQVNVGGEVSKSGCAPDELISLVQKIALLPKLHVRGLMTLPPWSEDPEEVRPYFRKLRQLADEVSALGLANVTMEELSMGMSDDFEVAIEEGATLIRVGTALFGRR
ncbi:MAG: YggS family pyridoxal phosphate-dependent enzyme [Desulfuromonas sp.]|nr:MAG: YggS family pyridoxal phosphate-dependent enzyme [Desulfuromonas sp.]